MIPLWAPLWARLAEADNLWATAAGGPREPVREFLNEVNAMFGIDDFNTIQHPGDGWIVSNQEIRVAFS